MRSKPKKMFVELDALHVDSTAHRRVWENSSHPLRAKVRPRAFRALALGEKKRWTDPEIDSYFLCHKLILPFCQQCSKMKYFGGHNGSPNRFLGRFCWMLFLNRFWDQLLILSKLSSCLASDFKKLPPKIEVKYIKIQNKWSKHSLNIPAPKYDFRIQIPNKNLSQNAPKPSPNPPKTLPKSFQNPSKTLQNR